MRRRARIALLALLAAAALPAAAEESPFRRGLWPLYTADARPWAGSQEARALGPFLHWESRDEEERFELRPLWSSLARDARWRGDLLYPLASRRTDPEREQSWLLLVARLRAEPESGRAERLLGLWFDGRTRTGQRYGGLFPLGGRLLDRFGFERIEFVLWPLFARASRGDYSEVQLLWPFFAWGRGSRDWKLRLWPFYGVERREGEYEHRFWLWPIVHQRRERLDSDTPREAWLCFPFWGHGRQGSRSWEFLLLPLYARRSDEARPGVGRLDLLWPLFSRARHADGGTALALRPLWSREQTPDRERTSWLLGLYQSERKRGDDFERDASRWLWVGGTRQLREGELERRSVEIWPLYRSVRAVGADGLERGFARVPWLLPLRGLEPDGWDRHYNKLFELWGTRWVGAERRSSWLHGLREVRRRDGVEWTSWGGWLQWRRSPPTSPDAVDRP